MIPASCNGRPPGDPAAVAAAARKCVALAGRIDGLDAGIAHVFGHSAFVGPARGDIDAALRIASLRTGRAGDDLLALAKKLADGAEQLRRRQHAWDREQAARRRDEARHHDHRSPAP